MSSGSTIIAGIEIPSVDPIFLALVGVHVLFALLCVVAGILAMLSRKGPGRHRKAGTFYYWCLSVVFASAALLSAIRWAENYHLFIVGTLAFAAASIGRIARRQRWRHWVKVHISGMGLSYVLLIVAFYLDNGKQLPLWRDLPPALYWLLPSAIGIPIIILALMRHPLSRRQSHFY